MYVPTFRLEDTYPTCVYSAVIPSAAMTKANVTNTTPHEDSAGAPAHQSRFDNSPRVSENSDSIGVSHMILSYEVPTKQLPDVNSEQVQVCAQEDRSPLEKISTMKLKISDRGDDLLYTQYDYKRPNITKQTTSHQESDCHQIIIHYFLLSCAPWWTALHILCLVFMKIICQLTLVLIVTWVKPIKWNQLFIILIGCTSNGNPVHRLENHHR